MWKATSVQVCNERGALGTAIGTISRLSSADGWEFDLTHEYVLATKGPDRLRFPISLVVVHETLVPDEKPAKKSREAA
jgi:hypothetical protein